MINKVFLSVILVIQFLIVTPSIAEPESLHNNQTCCEAGADIHGSVATGPWLSYPATRDDLYGDDGQFGNLTTDGASDPITGDFDYDGDVDGLDLAEFAAGGTGITLEEFAGYFGAIDDSEPSDNANLSALTISEGSLDPPFDPVTTCYSVTVENSIDEISVTPTTADTNATLTVNDIAVNSGDPRLISLDVGDNLISIVVTAEDTTIKTYYVAVRRSFEAQATAYVVDSPVLPNEFATLGEAINYLDGNLAQGQLGEVRVKTTQTMQVDSLSFGCDIIIIIEEGASNTIQGPGTSPLLIDAGGAFDVFGLSLVNSGGFVINAARRLAVVGSHFSADTSVEVNALGNLELRNNTLPGVTVNIGGTSGSVSLSKGSSGPEQTGEVSGNLLNLQKNIVEGRPFTVNANADISGLLSVENNNAPTLQLKSSYSILGSAVVNHNITEDVGIQWKIGVGAMLLLSNHSNLNFCNLDLDLFDQSKVFIESMVAMEATLSFFGESATIYLEASNLDKSDLTFGVRDLTFNGKGGQFGEFTANILEHTTWTQDGITVLDKFSIVSSVDSMVDLTFKGQGRFDNLFSIEAGGNFKLDLGGGTTLSGYAHVVAAGDFARISATRLLAKGGLSLGFKNVKLSIFASFGGAKQSEFGGTVNILGSRFYSASHLFQVQNASFMVGARIIFYLPEIGPFKPLPVAGSDPMIVLNAQNSTEGIIIRNVNFEGTPWLAPAIVIGDINTSIPITIEDCELKSDGGIQILNVNSPITIRNNDIEGTGINLGHVTGPVTITGNTLNVTKSPGVSAANMEQDVIVNSNTINASGYAAPALHAAWYATIRASSNEMISGRVRVGAPDALMALTGNAFAGAEVEDCNPSGGLLNDPVPANVGLSPYDVHTLIDWDGNGCADYPPDRNEKDEDGNCGMDGVPPPGG